MCVSMLRCLLIHNCLGVCTNMQNSLDVSSVVKKQMSEMKWMGQILPN